MGGLSLVTGSPERTDSDYVITLADANVRGRLWEVERVTRGAMVDIRHGAEFEPDDEIAAPNGSGRWLRFELSHIDDGLYVVESSGADALVYFEIFGGDVRRIFKGEQDIRREIRRQRR